MCIKQKEYNLTKTSLCKFVSKEQKKYKNYINSHQSQAEAEAVYKGVEKVLFEDGHHLHYRRYNSFDCIKQKMCCNRSATFKMGYHLFYETLLQSSCPKE